MTAPFVKENGLYKILADLCQILAFTHILTIVWHACILMKATLGPNLVIHTNMVP